MNLIHLINDVVQYLFDLFQENFHQLVFLYFDYIRINLKKIKIKTNLKYFKIYIFDEVLHAFHDLLFYILLEFHLTFVLKYFFHFHQNENLLLNHIKYYHYEFQ